MKPNTLTPAQRARLDSLRTKFPVGSRAAYEDTTVCGYRSRKKVVIGTIVLVRLASNDRYLVRILLNDGELDTIPDNLRPLKAQPRGQDPSTDIAP